MSHANCDLIKCRTRNLGKQQKTANPAKQVTAKNPAALKKDDLQPGQVVFSNQYQSQVLGKPAKGKDETGVHQPYKGGTIYCDTTSRFIHVEHQVALMSYKMIATKINFEQVAMEASVTVTTYHTDNGIYQSSEFLKDLHTKGQGIKMSGVSMQFQNGAVENVIRRTVVRAHTIMLHATLWWPEVKDQCLWPYALSHTA